MKLKIICNRGVQAYSAGNMHPISRLLGTVAMSLALVGCSGDDGKTTSEVVEPYVIGTNVFANDGPVAYIGDAASLSADEQFDLNDAREVPGGAVVYGDEGAGWYLLGKREEVTLTRFERGASGAFEEGSKLSLMGEGVSTLGNAMAFVSEAKAYYVDGDLGQLIVFDPTAMAITKTIDLSDAVNRDGFRANFEFGPFLRAGKLLVHFRWENYDNDPRITLPDTGLLVIDTKSDAVELQVEPRCNATKPAALPNGDILFVTDAYAAVAYALGALETEPCALRIRAGEDHFDPDYYVPLSSLTDRVAGEVALAGTDAVYLRLLDETIVSTAETQSIWDVAFVAAWRWYRWNQKDDSLEIEESLDYAAGAGPAYFVDGKSYIVQSTTDYSQSTLVDMTGPDGPVSGITVPGVPGSVLHVD